jgi:hypothetical protein
MDERARRIGVNEALFRAVNEQIEALNQRLVGTGPMDIVCECGSADCVERLRVELPEYERVRKDARRFIVAPGHVIPEFESVLEEHEAYHVIEKIHAEPEQIAEETDPRS